MSDATAEPTEAATADGGAEAAETGSSYWPDELVDTICALIVVTATVLGVLWFVVNG